MSRDFPDWINPWTAAQGRRRFAGTVPLGRMRRLVPLLECDDGEVAFEARFALDEDRRPVIRLQVQAVLRLLCQASLEPYDQPVMRDSALTVIESEAEIGLLAPESEPVQADKGRVALATLVEDELLLGLPQVPRNPDVTVVRYEAASTKGKPRPGAHAGDFVKRGGSGEGKGQGKGRGKAGAGKDAASADAPGGDERSNPFAVLRGKIGDTPGREPGESGS